MLAEIDMTTRIVCPPKDWVGPRDDALKRMTKASTKLLKAPLKGRYPKALLSTSRTFYASVALTIHTPNLDSLLGSKMKPVIMEVTLCNNLSTVLDLLKSTAPGLSKAPLLNYVYASTTNRPIACHYTNFIKFPSP